MDEKIQQPRTVPEAAHELRASDQIVLKLLKRGELEGFKIGKSWRITPESIERKRRGNCEQAK